MCPSAMYWSGCAWRHWATTQGTSGMKRSVRVAIVYLAMLSCIN
jgi:hypothetical protein